jgi:hypothetical protein
MLAQTPKDVKMKKVDISILQWYSVSTTPIQEAL